MVLCFLTNRYMEHGMEYKKELGSRRGHICNETWSKMIVISALIIQPS